MGVARLSELVVFSWYWTQPGGRTAYKPEHIAIWAAMIRRNLAMPHRIAVVTHEDIAIPGVELIRPPREFEEVRIPTWGAAKPQCHRRLVMFRPDAARWFGDRFVCMDLDVVVGKPLDPLFEGGEDFRIFKGTSSNRPYNGSLMMLRAGARPQVYRDFTPEKAAEAGQLFCGSDQAWLAHCLGWGERTWSEDDGVVHFRSGYRAGKPPPRMVFFPGALKPWMIAPADPYAKAHYRLERSSGLSTRTGEAA
jgi:hypothetical protein